MQLKKKKGASLLEAMIASALLSITLITFSQLHVLNFSIIRGSTQLTKTSTIISDFADQIRTRTILMTETEKTEQIDKYLLPENYNITKNQCNVPPDYVSSCLSTENDPTKCSKNQMVLFEVFNTMCGIYSITDNLNFNVEYCTGSTSHLCLFASIDGINRNQEKCKDDIDKCVILEIVP